MERGRRDPPGGFVVRACARLVPWSRRDAWRDEWLAELSYAYEARQARGGRPGIVALGLFVRSLGAVWDALWLWRRYRGGGFAGDVRYAWRSLLRRPGYALSVVGTLALGIGATTAIFSVVDPILLRSLPYAHADRLAELWTVRAGSIYPEPYMDVDTTFAFWRSADRLFDRVEAYADRNVIVTDAGEPSERQLVLMSPGLFELLGVRPLLGRLPAADEASAGGADVVVIGEGLWRGELGGVADVIGRTIELDDRAFTIIGVVPSSFRFPLGTASLWVPLRFSGAWAPSRVTAVVRVRERVARDVAQSRLDALADRLQRERPREGGWRVTPRYLDRSWVSPDMRNALQLLGGAVVFVLLIACVNAANLLLVQGTARRRELGVRAALGATRGGLVRLLLAESVLLAGLGGIAGVLLAYWGVHALLGRLPAELTIYTQASVGVDARVLVFALLLSLATGIGFGAGPALCAARADAPLGTAERQGTGSARDRRLRGALVIAELALSVMLLVGAGLLARSFLRLASVDPGFDPDGLLVLQIAVPERRYPGAAERAAFIDRLAQRLRGLPGVSGVSVSDGMPPQPSRFRSGLTVELEDGTTHALGTGIRLPQATVGDAFFGVLGIDMLDGRDFGPADVPGAPPSVVIDRDLAAFLWPGQRAVGRRFRLGRDTAWLTVVGVAGDVRLFGPDERTSPYALFFSLRQGRSSSNYRYLALRVTGEVGPVASAVRRTVRELGPDMPIERIERAGALLSAELAQRRFLLGLMVLFGALAIILAAIGVYGVIAYVVAQRTREIGVRVALGARRSDILRPVLARAVLLAVGGVALGLLAAVPLTRLIGGLLYQVAPGDPWTLVAVTLLLGAVACAAALVPALRAARVSPLEALRVD